MMFDGARVGWVGPDGRGHELGEEGTILSAEAGYSHVQWPSGKVEMVRNSDLAMRDDSLEGPVVGIDAQATLEQRGVLGLVSVLRSEGHLDALDSIATEANLFVSAKLRQDPSIREVLATIGEGSGEDLIEVATAMVLRRASREDG